MMLCRPSDVKQACTESEMWTNPHNRVTCPDIACTEEVVHSSLCLAISVKQAWTKTEMSMKYGPLYTIEFFHTSAHMHNFKRYSEIRR